MNTRNIGKIGEMLALEYLTARKFKILYQNWTCRWGEIDFIAEKDNFLIFIEVKYRVGLVNSHPSEAVNFYKLKSLKRSINQFLAKNFITQPWRLDLLCISELKGSLSIDYYEYISLNP